MDHGTCPTRATIQAPSGERPQETTTSAGEKDPGRALLSAPFGARGHGDVTETVPEGGHRRVLVVHERRAAVKTSSVHTVPIVDGAAAKVVEGRGGGVRVGAPAHPFGQTLVGHQGGGGGAGVPADYEGRVYRSGEGPPGGWGGDRWRGGRARAALGCTFLSSFSLVRLYTSFGDGRGGFLCLPFVFSYWWLGARL